MKKIILILLIGLLLVFATHNVCYATYDQVSASASIQKADAVEKRDYRVKTLENFFQKYNSPLKDYAYDFVSEADKNNIDWRLVPAIAGVESSFGKRIPKNSYNAYGWANGKYNFSSWDESIEVVSFTLKHKYIDRGALTIDQIATIYAPPSKTWAWKVKYFMKKIDSFPLTFTLQD
jgi:hypothetical protein